MEFGTSVRNVHTDEYVSQSSVISWHRESVGTVGEIDHECVVGIVVEVGLLVGDTTGRVVSDVGARDGCEVDV